MLQKVVCVAVCTVAWAGVAQAENADGKTDEGGEDDGNELTADESYPRIGVAANVGILLTGVHDGEDCMLIGASGHYVLTRWFSVGGSAGVLYHKFASSPNDTARVTKPFIEPSVRFNVPKLLRLGKYVAFIPNLEIGMTLVPSYMSQMYEHGTSYSYKTSCTALTVRTGFTIVLFQTVPIQLNYIYSTLDARRKVDPSDGRLRHRGMHGLQIGLKVFL